MDNPGEAEDRQVSLPLAYLAIGGEGSMIRCTDPGHFLLEWLLLPLPRKKRCCGWYWQQVCKPMINYSASAALSLKPGPYH